MLAVRSQRSMVRLWTFSTSGEPFTLASESREGFPLSHVALPTAECYVLDSGAQNLPLQSLPLQARRTTALRSAGLGLLPWPQLPRTGSGFEIVGELTCVLLGLLVLTGVAG